MAFKADLFRRRRRGAIRPLLPRAAGVTTVSAVPEALEIVFTIILAHHN